MLAASLGLIWIADPAGRVAKAQESDRKSAASAPAGAGARLDGGADGESSGAEPGGARADDGSENFLAWMIRASGWIGLVIAVMSFYLIALVVWMALHYRTPVAIPRELVRDVQNLLDQNKYNEAYHRLAEDRSFLARVLAGGVRKLPAGLAQAQRAMELANEDVTMEMEHRTTYLATVGTLGPMIGLVGTVYGMIMAFQVIALEGSSPQASQLAAGISTALFATLEGIAHLDPGDLLLRHVPQPDRAAVAGGGDDGRAVARAVRAGRAAGRPAEPGYRRSHGPAPSPPAHPHPFAVSAALAAAAAASDGRPALPPAEPSTTVELSCNGRRIRRMNRPSALG